MMYMVLESVDSQTDEMAGRFGAKIILSFPSGAYGAAAPAMLNYFKPAPAPAKGAPLPAEVQAELNARYTEHYTRYTRVTRHPAMCCISKLGDKMGVG